MYAQTQKHTPYMQACLKHTHMHAHMHAHKHTHPHTRAHTPPPPPHIIIQTKGRNQRDDKREKKRQEGKRKEYHSQHCVPYFVETDGSCQATQHEWQIVRVHIWQWYHFFRFYNLPHTQNGVNQFRHPACFICLNGTEPFNIMLQWSLQHNVTMITSTSHYNDPFNIMLQWFPSTSCYTDPFSIMLHTTQWNSLPSEIKHIQSAASFSKDINWKSKHTFYRLLTTC